MKADASILGLAAIALFLIWNSKSSGSEYSQEYITAERVPPDVTQSIIESIQTKNPDFVPLETIFINHQGDGTYLSRFMFMNTRHFYGTQLDVQARVTKDGNVDILTQKEAVVSDYAKAYKPDMYQPYKEIQDAIDKQLKYALSQPITTPPLDAYRR
jgi:hypothetical protein